ncbi:hypothetical protein ACGFZB_10870 [Streptomyces cinerochromogenes]|uniref:Uncharacterized protein n=1 Tax=Streptomyces cinerochromogenes TaxID=66422 RepID=A0ABW7B4B0_9ACTN
MATFEGKPTMSIKALPGNFYEFTIEYTMNYTGLELIHGEFEDVLRLMEEDDGSDHLYGTVQPTTFRPARSPETRVFRFIRSAESLDTEWGGEEIYAAVGHRRNKPGEAFQVRNTEVHPLAV